MSRTTQQQPTLLIMAAGLGSRFGGVKQLARVGPNDEAILDFSIIDARAAGFGDVVLIVRSDIEADVRAHIDAVHGNGGPADFVRYVRQDDLGPARDKPWGTLHAVLSAAGAVTSPFCVINADDYYGPASFQLAADQLANSAPGRGALVAFELGKTVPPEGTVSRGICDVADGVLVGVDETHDCERLADGTLFAKGGPVAEDTAVSMNMWCFHHGIMADFARRWEGFFAEHGATEKVECLLPSEVAALMDEGLLRVEVVSSPEEWIGITNPDDLELAKASLADR
ncbi:MAG: NTP transferase domain-containing protein [Acidimicrobiales bacterium]